MNSKPKSKPSSKSKPQPPKLDPQAEAQMNLQQAQNMEALAADPSLSRPAAAFALGLAKSHRAEAKLRLKQADWEQAQNPEQAQVQAEKEEIPPSNNSPQSLGGVSSASPISSSL